MFAPFNFPNLNFNLNFSTTLKSFCLIMDQFFENDIILYGTSLIISCLVLTAFYRLFLISIPVKPIPSPPAWPLLGHFLDFVQGFLQKDTIKNKTGHFLVDTLQSYKSFVGSIFHIFPLPFINVLVVSDAEQLSEILKPQNKKSYMKCQWAYSHFSPLLKDGLVVLEGKAWKVHRKLSTL